jgi:hypothetical protein
VKRLGFILVAIGFLGGSLASVVSETRVYWTWLAVAVGVGLVGVVLIRIGHRGQVHAVERLSVDMQAVETSLRRIVENVTRLNEQKQSIDPYDVRRRIDALFPKDLSDFVSARRSIAHIHGLAAYANVMSAFAAGERYLNRVWSASADGYIDEVHEYLAKAKDQFDETLALLRRLQAGPSVQQLMA